MEQLKTIGRELAIGSHGGWGQSKEFLDLVKSIGEARSKAEEDRIILREVESLRRRIAEPDVPRRKMKEYIIRLVYAEMLGHDASFGYIHAVKMTHDDALPLKRTGYLAVTLFLSEDHDLIILIVNTIQKDLRSDNYLVVCAALAAVCKLINEETIPAVLPQVVDLLAHPKEAVRRKAVMALHRFYQRSPASRLCDNDPGVMGATLCPLFDLISADVNSYKDLVISFVGILKQVAERRLPKTYDYHQMAAPFIQIKLLKILALLGSGDKQASGHMYNSDSHNLKYMGVDALGRLIRINPDIAEEHQLAVIDCLEDPDDTLKRKTFELLYKMTKPTNVEVIVDRMIEYMINISDNHYKTEIASRCVELAEQFAPTNEWFIRVICWVLGEYGTADGKYPAAYIIGKLCDVTEALLCDDTVKCQSLIDELSTSHSTDLQQRAYELQALLCLESQAVESVMPLDASCEDIEIDKNLTFLKDFVQQSIENGARPYIPESERSGTSNVSNFKSQYQHEASSHMLRFEAYELPRPSPAHVIPQVSVPTPIADFFPVPETTYNSETSQASKLSSVADASSAAHGIKLHLDGVQRRWGRPTYSSSSGPSSTTSTEKTTNGVTHIDGVGSQSRDKLNESRRQQPEVSAEKQKLAASLFGGSAGKTEKKATSTQRAPKGNTRNAERPGVSRSVSPETSKEKAAPSVPDLLDLGEPNPTSTTIVDPFKQLEGLVGPTPVPSPLDNSVKTSGLETPDLMAAVYTDLPPSGSSSGSLTSTTRDMHSADKTSNTATSEPSIKKGPFPQDSLRKDARARQVGVTPTRNNPNLFKDLLG
ncbi:AP-4 complex subunit [Musa troglodytarum]|uniref:AP-4 complex subunit n=1 Tax=Musa troglodytarum TaxID=320322 RepID=A0A9E7EKN1_9LILI|nr:AP-4 complex subunit [Musa troglodytarum]